MIHGDEGRGKKRTAVLCLSVHSILGAGVETMKKRALSHQKTEQQMNYKGLSHVTRFLLGILPKSFYEGNDALFDAFISFLTKDLQKLALEGLTGPDGQKYYAAVVSCKGDWPWLHKVGKLTRSFYNQPKRESSKKECVGICHWCLAGRDAYPFEDLAMGAEWQFTMGIEKPWLQQPPILDHCTHDPTFPETFFWPDPWHSWHLGEGRHFVCNILKMLEPLTPGRNADLRVDRLFEIYTEYCSKERRQCYASKFSQALFGLKANDYPQGSWTKGNFTTSLVKWLASYLESLRNTFQPGSLLEKAEA